MHSSLCRLVLAAILAFVGSAANAQRPMSDQELTDRAQAIVVGRAITRETMWVGQDLVTLVTVSVDQPLKGAPGANLTVALPGGIDMRRRIPIEVAYVDAPRVATGEEVLLFLERADRAIPGAYVVSGFSQGKRSIVTDAAGVKWVSRNQAAAAANPQVQSLQASAVPTAPVGAARLSEVRDAIRQRLQNTAP